MKILRLAVCNLASLAGEHEIDFEQAPLQSAGLIAITGRTGAGKSTLLDAICLALYHQVPRLRQARNKGKMLDVNGESLQLDDSKHILTRGTTRGYAELDFVGLDGKHYRALWLVKRAYKRTDGKLGNDYKLTCLDDQRTLATQVKQVRAEIDRVVGLSFEQFTRAVLLAQSEVGAFLKASDHERAALLEYLTNSDIFSLIGQVSFEKTRDARQALDQCRQLHGLVQLPSEAEIAEQGQQAAQLQNRINGVQQQDELLAQAQHWYTRQNELQQAMSQVSADLQQRQADAPHFERLQQQQYQLEQFAQIRPVMAQRQDLERRIQAGQQQFAESAAVVAALTSQFHQADQIRQQSQQQLTAQREQIRQLQPAFQQAQRLDAERERLTLQQQDTCSQLQRQQGELQHLTEQSAGIERQLQQINERQQHITAELANSAELSQVCAEPQAIQERIEDTLQQHKLLSEQIRKHGNFSLDDFARQCDALTRQLEAHIAEYGDQAAMLQLLEDQRQRLTQSQQLDRRLDILGRSLQRMRELDQQRQHLRQRQQDIVQQISQQQQTEQELHKAHQHAQQQLQQLQAIMAEQQLLQAESVEQLRQSLQPEQPCMVCGSTSHPYVDHAEQLAQALQRIHDHQLQQARQTAEAAEQHWHQAHQQLTRSQATSIHLTEQISQLDEQWQTSCHQLQQDHDAAGLDWFSVGQHSDLPAWLERHQQEMTSLQQYLTEQIQRLEQLEQQQHQREIWLKQQHQHQQLSEQMARYQAAERQLLHRLPHIWSSRWTAQPGKTARQLLDAIQTRLLQQQQQRDLQQQHDQLQQQQQQYASQQTWLYDQHQQTQQQLDQLKQQAEQQHHQLRTLLEQHQASSHGSGQSWQHSLYQLQQEIEQQLEQDTQHSTAIRQQLDQQQQQHTQLQQQLTLWQEQAQHAGQQIADWQQTHPDLDDPVQQWCLQQDQQVLSQLRQAIQQYQQQLADARGRLAQLQQDHSQHQRHQPELCAEDVTRHRQQLQIEWQHLHEQRAQLQAAITQYHQLKQQQQRYQNQIDALTAEVERWTKISDLIGDREGKHFKTIAQSYYLDILLEHANAQLQPLTQRYQLTRIDDSLGLAVIDLDMDGSCRPVHSLSGGESFLVSLALALAIASMAAGSMKLDTLFIDEGFGTLDPDSLMIAMDALDKLHSQGRKVILISHVQEMHERIPVKIQVEAQGNGRSRISVVA